MQELVLWTGASDSLHILTFVMWRRNKIRFSASQYRREGQRILRTTGHLSRDSF